MDLFRPIKIDLQLGVDRKDLRRLAQRYLNISEQRLKQSLQHLNTKQRGFIDALALFFHVNHSQLPGYINENTPFGVANFSPNKAAILGAKNFWSSFDYKKQHHKRSEILGIYLMGSTGSIAHGLDSDFDVWLIHRHNINQNRLHYLQQRCELLEKIAQSLGIDLHIFLINPIKFSQGNMAPLSSEASGSTQHFLLLDEFYRSAIYLAGRYPLWWFIPWQQEAQYQQLKQQLLDKRFIKAEQVFDLGGVASIPKTEFIGAGLWQLYKGIESPIKAILKLSLIEAYANEYPNVKPLCLLYKEAVFFGIRQPFELDSYRLMLTKIEQNLEQQPQRKDRIRQCFYLKINHRLNRKDLENPDHPLNSLVQRWQWPLSRRKHLNNARYWSAQELIKEQSHWKKELNTSYAFLQETAKALDAKSQVSQRELLVLQRKLYAAFERRAGKVDRINNVVSSQLDATELYFHKRKNIWLVSACASNLKSKTISRELEIRSASTLIELLIWCYLNGLLKTTTKLTISEKLKQALGQIKNLISYLDKNLDIPKNYPKQKYYTQNPYLVSSIVIVNFWQPLAHELVQRYGINNNTNISHFYLAKKSLVNCIDVLSLNSWGEFSIQHFEGEDALVQHMRYFLNLAPPQHGKNLPKPKIALCEKTDLLNLNARIEKLLAIFKLSFYQRFHHHCRLIMQMGSFYYALEQQQGQSQYCRFDNMRELLTYLSQPLQQLCHTMFAENTLEQTPFPSIYNCAQEAVVQIYFQHQSQQVQILLLDQFNALTHYRADFDQLHFVLKPLKRFLQQVSRRLQSRISAPNSSTEIQFYQLSKQPQEKSYSNAPHLLSLDATEYFDVQVIAPCSSNAIYFVFYCDDVEFSQLDHGDQLFLLVAQFIKEKRRYQGSYPCYITDLDIQLQAQSQAVTPPATTDLAKLCADLHQKINQRALTLADHLSCKQALEHLLNQALAADYSSNVSSG